ncbi:MAG: hypothetical protein R3F49_01220 [Planctomycetota bacterium]
MSGGSPGETPHPTLSNSPDVTLVVPVTAQRQEFEQVVDAFGRELDRLGRTWECILVFDGIKGAAWERGTVLQAESGGRVGTIALHRPFGESVCLSSAFENARGELILTLPQYVQVDPHELTRLFDALDAGADMAASRREPRVDSKLNQAQSWMFNWVVRVVTGASFRDLNSTTRLMRREVLEQLTIYGSMYRYLPATAYRQGFRVDEVAMRHLSEWGGASVFGPGVYMRRALDVVGLMFLSRFTHKPLRFFGALGGAAILLGGLMVAWQLLHWAMSDIAYGLYQRPAFLFGVLLVVLGSQTIGFGLVGEIIIYTQARNLREYRIEKVYE